MIWLIISILFAATGLSVLFKSPAEGITGLVIATGLYFWKGKKFVSERIVPKMRKSSINPMEIKFVVVSWGEYVENIRSWQANYAKDNWVNAQYSSKPTYHYAWKDNIYSVKLQPEPDNKHDKNAIAVYLDNYVVGYVPSEINESILNAIKNAYFITASVRSGDYKYIDSNGDLVVEHKNPIVEIFMHPN